MYTFQDLVDITSKLRSEEGCPWDRAQTHESLEKHLEEETGEVLEAIDEKDMDHLCEELGDLLFQVMLHSQIAREEGGFSIEDVVNGICEKMVRRHPRIFGGEMAEIPLEGRELWEEIKRREKAKKALNKGKKP